MQIPCNIIIIMVMPLNWIVIIINFYDLQEPTATRAQVDHRLARMTEYQSIATYT